MGCRRVEAPASRRKAPAWPHGLPRCPADELRNNRQKICSPPDFVEDPTKAGLKLLEYCSEVGGGMGWQLGGRMRMVPFWLGSAQLLQGRMQHAVPASWHGGRMLSGLLCAPDGAAVAPRLLSPPGPTVTRASPVPCPQPAPTPGDTYVNVTLEFVDACNKDKPTKLTIQGLVRQCEAGGQAQNPLLQPWQADSVKVAVQPLPPNCECAGGPCLVFPCLAAGWLHDDAAGSVSAASPSLASL